MKLDDAKIYTELSPRELTILYSLVADSNDRQVNKCLNNTSLIYNGDFHVCHLFKTIGMDDGISKPNYILYRKLKKLFDDMVKKTKPEVKTIWYYIALDSSGDGVDTYVSDAFSSAEDAESHYLKHYQHSYELIEIVRKDINVNF